MTITLQDLQVLNEKANADPYDDYAKDEFRYALVAYYESGELQRLAELAEDGLKWRAQFKNMGISGNALAARAPSVKEGK